MPLPPVKYSLEQYLLSMGPRSHAQFREAMLKFKVTVVPAYALETDTGYIHVVHAVARDLFQHHSEAVSIKSLFDSTALAYTFFDQLPTVFMKKYVQLMPGGKHVRAASPLNIFDVATMIAYIKSQGICGTARSTLCGEYPAAYVDLEECVRQKKCVGTSNYIWHVSQVTQKTGCALEMWRTFQKNDC